MYPNLNPQQNEAVACTEGPLLILAGAGSGKTLVLTYRIAHILKNKLAYPQEILALTFTNKAANEMKERIYKLLYPSTENESFYPVIPFMGTFHSICAKILRFEGNKIEIPSNFTIYDDQDQLQTVKNAISMLHMDPKEINPRTIHGYISSAKNELITSDQYKSFAKGYIQEATALAYPVYERLLKENNALDFDDLILKTVFMFMDHKDILEKYQNKFKYILVDEYQDTNTSQYKLTNLLAKKHKNICVVGDDDQSIYSWRGADIKNILSFEQDYPETKIIKLEQNYRSTKNILEAAYEVIKHNQMRKEKKLWTDKNDGPKINIYTAMDEKDESHFVAGKILDLQTSGCKLNDMAILYRTNAQSRILEETMLNYNIPYIIYGGISFYSRKEIKDIIAYLKVLNNPDDTVNLKRIINVPPRKIGAKTIEKIDETAKENEISIGRLLLSESDKFPDNKGLKQFSIILKKLFILKNKISVSSLINEILNLTGYIEYIDDKSEESKTRIENLKELQSVAQKYDNSTIEDPLAEFLAEVSLIEEQQVKAQSKIDRNRVTLMTLHSAKGLEFEHVFIVGMEESIFPHERSLFEQDELEEERRLAYVGITRAKENLYLTHSETRLFFGMRQNNLISRFIEDIPSQLVTRINWENKNEISTDYEEPKRERPENKNQNNFNNVKIGDTVVHPVFGQGRLIDFDESTVKVSFINFGTKVLSIDYANLKKI